MKKAQRKLAKWFKKAEQALSRKQAQKALKKAEKWFKKAQENDATE